ncbi:Guanyl-specific ribonuclease St [Corynebacterium urogenitale]|uniref:Guanyl-specific ribonuclease St n=1 Tax=Corynebacterium urogenitale TaxID=2487892 RepID=A0A5J6Z710_9CORY|nr:Guanyl-specific ribonuclease St [Corynebacterium urogenitale]
MNGMDSKALKKLAPVAVAALAATGWFGVQAAQNDGDNGNHSGSQLNSSASDECTYDTLPAEAQDQIEDILDGADPDDGPHDGKHFGNYEGLLPKENSQYYREYTVKTPGMNHRGERRIVVGGGSDTDPDVWYYTSDHYESFCSIPDAEG